MATTNTHFDAFSVPSEPSRSDALGAPSDQRSLGLVGDDILIDLTIDPPVIELRDKRLELDPSPPKATTRVLIRAFDVVASAGLLVATAPLLALLWVGVKATSSGPGIYRSPRVGQTNFFDAFKFRTMVVNADKQLEDILRSDPAASDAYQRCAKLVDDPRVTRLGRLLRRASLDELPQLWNVFRGDMSLVGPRPSLLSEPERYGLAMPTVRKVKPGLTGLWQVSGRSDLAFDERIMLDVEYATTRRLRDDARIIARTIVQLCRPGRHGAY